MWPLWTTGAWTPDAAGMRSLLGVVALPVHSYVGVHFRDSPFSVVICLYGCPVAHLQGSCVDFCFKGPNSLSSPIIV